MGGVAVSDTTLYLSGTKDTEGRPTILAIPLNSLPAEGSHELVVEQSIPVPVSPSFLSFSGGYLWVGNFYHPGADYGLSAGMDYTTENAEGEKLGCYIMGYDMTNGDTGLTVAAGDRYAQPDVVLAAPNKMQGVVVKDGAVTLSQSYGRKNNACLLRYALALDEAPDTALTVNGREVKAYLLDSARQTAALTVMPMTEALADAPDGGIYVLFESGATHYANGTYRTDHVWMGAGCAAYVGATQLDRSKQRDKCSIEAFTERRNGVACRCCWWSLGWDLPCKGQVLPPPGSCTGDPPCHTDAEKLLQW